MSSAIVSKIVTDYEKCCLALIQSLHYPNANACVPMFSGILEVR
jgi:hypothetical protein